MAEKTDTQKIIESLDYIHKMCIDTQALCKGYAARLDTIEENHKKLQASADAEETERKEKLDAATRAADAATKRSAVDSTNTPEFAAAQMRADSAYQALAKRAPMAQLGETLRDFRVRLLNPLKQHSKRYCDSDLSLIGDDAAFCDVEQRIINDSIEASNAPPPAGAPLRATTTVDKDTGHRVTRYYGDPAIAWADFMGGRAKFVKIVRPIGRHQDA